jgi:hypothetical protein
LGLASLREISGRASTLYRARDRARRLAIRDEDLVILREKRGENTSEYAGMIVTRRHFQQQQRRSERARRLYTSSLEAQGGNSPDPRTPLGSLEPRRDKSLLLGCLPTEYRTWIPPRYVHPSRLQLLKEPSLLPLLGKQGGTVTFNLHSISDVSTLVWYRGIAYSQHWA